MSKHNPYRFSNKRIAINIALLPLMFAIQILVWIGEYSGEVGTWIQRRLPR